MDLLEADEKANCLNNVGANYELAIAVTSGSGKDTSRAAHIFKLAFYRVPQKLCPSWQRSKILLKARIKTAA